MLGLKLIFFSAWIPSLILSEITSTVIKFEAPSKNIYGDRTFKKLSSTKEINFLACAARIKKDCVVPSRKAFHFDENLQMCECGQLSRFDEVAVGTKVNSLSGMVMADTWSISKIDYSNYDAPFPEIEIPLKGADYSLFELNLNSTKQPYPNPIGAIADTDFEDHTVAKLSANLVYQVTQTSLADFSVLVWFKAPVFDPPHYVWTLTESDNAIRTGFVIKANGTIELGYRDLATISFGDVPIMEDVWTNIGYVFEEGTSKLYLNGEFHGSAPFHTTNFPDPFGIGSITLGKGGTTGCNCYLTEFALYPMALNDSSVKALVQQRVF